MGSRKNPNRRALLMGAAACALVPLIPVRPESSRRVKGGVDDDPALKAYARMREVERALAHMVADEGDPAYLDLLAIYDRAEAALADTRATTPEGIRAKLNHVAYIYAPDAEDQMCRSPLAVSIVADFEHLLKGKARCLDCGGPAPIG